ncbi:MAG: LysR family transcriptional regulator [Sphingomonadaceae bacterium]
MRDLRLLVAIVESGSLHRAANALSLTVAAVSKALIQLEQRLGVRLFDRFASGVSPTPAGQRLVASARRILADLDRDVAGALSVADDLAGMVRIGLGPFPASSLIDSLLPQVEATWPALTLEVVIGYPEDLLAKLGAGELDFIICHLNDVRLADGFEALAVQRLAPVVLVGRHHPLAGRAEVEGRDLAGFRMAGSRPYGASLDWFRLILGTEARHALVSADYDLIGRAVRATTLFTVCSHGLADRLCATYGLVALPLALPPINHVLYCVSRAGAAVGPAIEPVRELACRLLGPDEA